MASPWWKWPVFSFQLSSSERGELNSSYGQLQVAVTIIVYIKKINLKTLIFQGAACEP